MPERAPALTLRDVSKRYRLYSNRTEQLLDVLGLSRLLVWRSATYAEHPALSEVSLSIAAGERVELVGRNGAGKTTL